MGEILQLSFRAPALAAGALAHAGAVLACAAWLLEPARPVDGQHPATKPLRFAFSIAVFLFTLSLIVPAVSLSPGWQRAVERLLVGTMAVEMVCISLQAWRGVPSHYNRSRAFDRALWAVMMAAVLVATFVMGILAVVASTAPLLAPDRTPLAPALAIGCRVALWLFLLSAVSGFLMGGRGSHTVGASDGGPGLPVLGWSTVAGDLRVSHFVALHALQLLPGAALLLGAVPALRPLAPALVLALSVAAASVCLFTLGRALAGRPFLRGVRGPRGPARPGAA